VAATAPGEAPVDPAVRLRESALATLGTTPLDRTVRLAAGFDWMTGAAAGVWAVAELGEAAAKQDEWRGGGEAELTVSTTAGTVVASARGPLSPSSRTFAWRSGGQALEAGDYLVRLVASPSDSGGGRAAEQVRFTVPASGAGAQGQPATPRLLRRGPATGLAFVPTANARFRRVERVRVVVSVAGDPPEVSGRLLDRRGQALGVPVAASVRDEEGLRAAVAEVNLAPLAPGDYLVELTLAADRSRQTILTAIRIVP
jgi:hypothetical protein